MLIVKQIKLTSKQNWFFLFQIINGHRLLVDPGAIFLGASMYIFFVDTSLLFASYLKYLQANCSC